MFICIDSSKLITALTDILVCDNIDLCESWKVFESLAFPQNENQPTSGGTERKHAGTEPTSAGGGKY